MVDCHMHMVLDGVYFRDAIGRHAEKPDMTFIRNALAQYQALGFTYLRDGGDRWGVGKAARQIAPEYGIRYRTPLSPLCAKGHYGAFIGEVYENLDEYTALVRKMKAAGADFIKIMISGLMDFDRFGVLTEEGLDPKLITQLIHIAHQEGMAVMAHANGARTMEAAAVAGVDSIEHGAYADEDSLQAMVENKVIWVPTLSTVGNLSGKGRFDQEAVEKILENALFRVGQFARLGGLVAPGSDAGAWAVPHGSLEETDYLQQAGVTQDQYLSGAAAIMAKF